MMDVFGLLLAVAAGGGLSLLYFGGLWLTVQRAVEAGRPKTLLLGSFVIRTGLVLLGFYLVIRMMGDRWELLIACLLGFLVGRFLLVRRWRPQPSPST